MRRYRQLRQCAALYPTQFNFVQNPQENLSRERHLVKPGLILQLALLALLAAFSPAPNCTPRPARLQAQ